MVETAPAAELREGNRDCIYSRALGWEQRQHLQLGLGSGVETVPTSGLREGSRDSTYRWA
jgi:hypothetical protein